MSTTRGLARPLGAIWLAVLLVGALQFGWTDPAILIFATLGACLLLGFLLWPRRRTRPGPAPVLKLVPDPRRAFREPRDGARLIGRLAGAGLGRVTSEPGGLRVQSPEGAWLHLRWPEAEGATSANLRIEASSESLALEVCDALAPVLGPFTLEVDGVGIFLDGTTPTETLQRELWNRRMQRLS